MAHLLECVNPRFQFQAGGPLGELPSLQFYEPLARGDEVLDQKSTIVYESDHHRFSSLGCRFYPASSSLAHSCSSGEDPASQALRRWISSQQACATASANRSARSPGCRKAASLQFTAASSRRSSTLPRLSTSRRASAFFFGLRRLFDNRKRRSALWRLGTDKPAHEYF